MNDCDIRPTLNLILKKLDEFDAQKILLARISEKLDSQKDACTERRGAFNTEIENLKFSLRNLGERTGKNEGFIHHLEGQMKIFAWIVTAANAAIACVAPFFLKLLGIGAG